ncbi:MAG TPA: 6-hydroxycyclohex-1-ene-1-carbonyl-CoA dehydrogenase [Planctomycetota bacterium]
MSAEFYRWLMTAPDRPLVREAMPPPEPQAGQVRVRVVGCGVCHTDLGFLRGGVRTRHALPLALGHEIAGVVDACGAGAESWQDRPVLVPAVLPCGECELCGAGRETACRNQSMPGNDFHGGFASHLTVAARWLVDASGMPAGLELADLAVVADAVTTPYQAMVRAGVDAGDELVIIGVGGIGSFGVQIAAALGARVVAVDVDEARLERACRFGATAGVRVVSTELKATRKAVRDACNDAGFRDYGLKVLEMSGTPAGQELAWSLMSHAGTVGIIGFCLDKVAVRLSNLMAFDADAFGSWGCRPQLYRPALDLVCAGRVHLKPFIRHYPMGEINAVLDEVHAHRVTERPILVP